MKLMILTSLLLSAFSLTAGAAVPSGLVPKPLATITNDQDSTKLTILALSDRNDQLVGIHSRGQGVDKTFWLKDIEKPAGVPLVEKNGYNVINLQGELSRDTQEGRLTARFLVNALFGSAEPCQFELKKNEQGWYIKNIYTKKAVALIHVRASSVGVNELQGLCPAR